MLNFIKKVFSFFFVFVFEYFIPALPFFFWSVFFLHLSMWLYFNENPLSDFYMVFSSILFLVFSIFFVFSLVPISWLSRIVGRDIRREKFLLSGFAFIGAIAYYFVTPEPKEVIMRKNLDFYDARSKYHVWLAKKHEAPQGKAYPYVPPPYFLYYHLEDERGRRIVPFGMVSKSLVVLCNESGRWITYYTDRFGFRNPDSYWDRAAEGDLLFLGDSFAQGWCVQDGETYADILRNEFDMNVLSVSGSGVGPLMALAMLREYGEFAKPSTVIYMYAEANDLLNLKWSWKNRFMRLYLEPDFSQNLTQRVQEIDILIHEFISWYVQNSKMSLKAGRLWSIIRLGEIYFRTKELRDILRFVERDRTPLDMIDIFAFVVEKMKEETERIGADFLFVYLPDWYRFARGFQRGRKKVLRVLREKGVRFIDLTEEFSSYPDPLTFFPFRRFGHYNSSGYRVLAQKIAEYFYYPRK